MNQELEKLISLQGIDSKISNIKSLAGDLPQRVRQKEESIEGLKIKINNLNEELEKIEKENRKIKTDTEDGQINLNKYKDQLFLVKSNKEYDALNQEIDHLKKIISESEEIYISFESKKEELLESKKISETEVESLTETLLKEKEKLDTTFHDSKIELDQLNQKRKNIKNQINLSYLSSYDRLKNSRGMGISSLVENCCGSCYSTLPPQTIVEIKSNNIIHSCPSCSVYLYWEEKEEEE